jgi:hypothetical protein
VESRLNGSKFRFSHFISGCAFAIAGIMQRRVMNNLAIFMYDAGCCLRIEPNFPVMLTWALSGTLRLINERAINLF